MGEEPVKNIIVTGVTGMDGSMMADHLLATTNHNVYGTVRRSATLNRSNIEHLLDHPRFKVVYMDLQDHVSIETAVEQVRPDFFLNFAAQSFVGESWRMPIVTFDIDATGVMKILEVVRRKAPNCRVYSAGSSEEYGDVTYCPQDINHPLRPRSPYGVGKAAARLIVKVYRESYDIWCVHCVCFNHEGPRRGREFVTRKITRQAAQIRRDVTLGNPVEMLVVGNIFASRDWSYAGDIVQAIWKIMSAERPKDYVLASGETHTVKEFIEAAFSRAGFYAIDWAIDDQHPENTFAMASFKRGDGSVWRGVVVTVSKDFYRPAEVDLLMGDASQARKEIGWEPTVDFVSLVNCMVDHDVNEICG